MVLKICRGKSGGWGLAKVSYPYNKGWGQKWPKQASADTWMTPYPFWLFIESGLWYWSQKLFLSFITKLIHSELDVQVQGVKSG